MTRRAALLLAAAVALGVGVAVAVIAGRDGGGPAARPHSSEAAARATPVSNQIRLSRAESVRLVDWAARFRTCMAHRGVVLARPVPHEKEIDLPIRNGPTGPV